MMHIDAIRNSLCYECRNKDYDILWTSHGARTRNYMCIYIDKRHIFGRVYKPEQCHDYESEQQVTE